LELKKNLVTASYVSKEMKELNQQVKEANLIFLNEIGLDPGIDHLSTMKVID
jgi:saccharopine dehydrogenase (NAD+, L-glutamate forming)